MLVTGAHGLLGSAVTRAVKRRGWDAVPCGRVELDVTEHLQVRNRIDEVEPDLLIHCAAFTAVDLAESESDRAFLVNEIGAAHVAQEATARGVQLVAVSTDYVFRGRAQRPYLPTDATDPLSQYGRSKLAGERVIQHHAPEAAIVRTAGLFGGGARDFTDVVLERAREGLPLRVVSDQVMQPTHVDGLADVLIEFGSRRVSGLWHVTDLGPTSWFDFARAVLAAAGLDAFVEPVTAEEWAAPAARPLYSVLDVSETERELGRALPSWRDTLLRHLGSEGR